MLSRRLRAPTEREVSTSIGDGLMAAYQKKLDEEVLKAIDKVNFDNVRCDIDISASNCVRLTSSGEQSFGDMLDWFVVPGNATDAFVREFLAFMVKLRMLEGIRMKELIWRMTPKLINSVDGWAVVSWVRSRSTQGYYMSGEVYTGPGFSYTENGNKP